METKKVLVKENDAAVITCPFCHTIKKASVARYKERNKRELKIKCGCANVFSICLECRKHPRKPIKLIGKSINLSKHRESRDVIIKDISMGGIQLHPFRKHRIRKDDRLQISFSLNDANNTPITTHVTVKTVFKDHVGCEFNSIEEFRTSLGFYLID